MASAFQSAFQYHRGVLRCESVPLDRVADRVGTPAYVYSRATIERNFLRFDRAFGKYPHLVCYAVKACGNLSILRLLARLGAGFDIVSGGELYRVLKAGGDPKKIVFSGVGKTEQEMDDALRAGILKFNVESPREIEQLARRAVRLKKRASVALRVNPDVVADTHPYISTGLRQHKFGVDMENAERLYLASRKLPNIEMCGVSCHIGSQILDLAPFLDALDRLRALAGRLIAAGLPIRYLDVGGGLGVAYRTGDAYPDPADYVQKIVQRVKATGLTIMIEPGRSIVAESGVLLTKVLNCKKNGDKNFVIVDAGMNDLLRPALYGAHHEIRPVRKPTRQSRSKSIVADVVGPVCETGDFLARDRELPQVKMGDLLVVETAGAYGSALGSNYNARPKPPEVLAHGVSFRVVRKRETFADLVRNEQ